MSCLIILMSSLFTYILEWTLGIVLTVSQNQCFLRLESDLEIGVAVLWVGVPLE